MRMHSLKPSVLHTFRNVFEGFSAFNIRKSIRKSSIVCKWSSYTLRSRQGNNKSGAISCYRLEEKKGLGKRLCWHPPKPPEVLKHWFIHLFLHGFCNAVISNSRCTQSPQQRRTNCAPMDHKITGKNLQNRITCSCMQAIMVVTVKYTVAGWRFRCEFHGLNCTHEGCWVVALETVPPTQSQPWQDLKWGNLWRMRNVSGVRTGDSTWQDIHHYTHTHSHTHTQLIY